MQTPERPFVGRSSVIIQRRNAIQTQTKTSRIANMHIMDARASRREKHGEVHYPSKGHYKRMSARAERKRARIEAAIEAAEMPTTTPQPVVRCVPVFNTRSRCLGFVEIAA